MTVTVVLLVLIIGALLWRHLQWPSARDDILIVLIVFVLVILALGNGVPAWRPMFCQ